MAVLQLANDLSARTPTSINVSLRETLLLAQGSDEPAELHRLVHNLTLTLVSTSFYTCCRFLPTRGWAGHDGGFTPCFASTPAVATFSEGLGRSA